MPRARTTPDARTEPAVDAAAPPAGGASAPGAGATADPGVELKPAPGPAAAELTGPVEAILLTQGRAVPFGRLAVALGLLREDADDEEHGVSAGVLTPRQASQRVADAVTLLNSAYESTGRSFRIEATSGGYRVMTLPAFGPFLASFNRAQQPGKLSKPAIEALAIIAYKQPVTRAQLEAIRGVSCGEVLKTLMDRRLVSIKGRAEEVGRPILYGTTRQFLDQFGLASLKDLPGPAELSAP
jgi:segregation and condensation protein B